MTNTVCGKSPKRYPGMKCCVAYTPERLRGSILGIPIRGAEGPHRHMATRKFKDGSIGIYTWGPGTRKPCWAVIENGQTKPITREEFETRAMKEAKS